VREIFKAWELLMGRAKVRIFFVFFYVSAIAKCVVEIKDVSVQY